MEENYEMSRTEFEGITPRLTDGSVITGNDYNKYIDSVKMGVVLYFTNRSFRSPAHYECLIKSGIVFEHYSFHRLPFGSLLSDLNCKNK